MKVEVIYWFDFFFFFLRMVFTRTRTLFGDNTANRNILNFIAEGAKIYEEIRAGEERRKRLNTSSDKKNKSET
jgi:hypothetical protein